MVNIRRIGLDYCPSCDERMSINGVKRYYSTTFHSYVLEIDYVCKKCSIKIVHYDLTGVLNENETNIKRQNRGQH